LGKTKLEVDALLTNPDRLSNASDHINRLAHLIKVLRGPNGCTWDKKQTATSISVYLIEEVYELVEAITSDQTDAICEELGDVLFHILFIIRLFEESKAFDLNKTVENIVAKMIRRHPHVFGDSAAESVADIRKQWRKIKKEEKKGNKDTFQGSVLDTVPSGLPALMRAYRVSERAAGAGFDWDDIQGVMEKVEEEWDEFKEVAAGNHTQEIALEFGDLLFTLMNVARMARIHPETALTAATQKFEKRYRHMENEVTARGKETDTVPREELERLWEEAKRITD